MHRRDFLRIAAASSMLPALASADDTPRKPNIVYLLADQWRAQALGFARDPNVKTPHIDRLASESTVFSNAVANCPVCTPSRACLLTSQYPNKHGLFINDVPLDPNRETMGDIFKGAGYDTAWIGKWHVDGHGRTAFIPRERRQGFDTWMTLECTHDYNHSAYYADSDELRYWNGYDAIAQTRAGCDYIRRHADGKPFCLVLSWGPPHNPYETAPAEYKALYDPTKLALRENVPPEHEAAARKDLAGYYAHCSALDACVGEVMATLEASGLADNTILVFTSDHGDMLFSQGQQRKQRPWDESILVPFIIRCKNLGIPQTASDLPFGTVDILPTLCDLCGIEPPADAQGKSIAHVLRGSVDVRDDGVLIACYSPFGEWTRANGGREYRGIRTRRHTYVKTLEGPWLLYDNLNDPYQRTNLINNPDAAEIQQQLEAKLRKLLEHADDSFEPGPTYINRWGYNVDETGTART